ncbi:hypothetical protein [Microbacterium sp. XT11]|uniref:hypothetical protein n=1 Tax=Microbacterium sp. XT11 TaxID=367477 RepID=UPI000A8C6410|nr:hypothetical protein [Microbacterium sp. XT11]
MPAPRPLPPELGPAFTVRQARAAGVARSRLRKPDLHAPYRGVRSVIPAEDAASDSPYVQQADARRRAVRAYAPKLERLQFVSHESAAALWHAPLPLAFDEDERLVAPEDLPVHISTFGRGHLVRASGVRAHRARIETSRLVLIVGIRVADPATTWASLGSLPLIDLIALGDYFCRVWRTGVGRPDAGTPPLATPAELQRAIDAGRRTGIRRLREAIDLIRLDSWSPRESAVRCHLVFAGLPEPELNVDVHDEQGRFLGCVDLAYPEWKIAIEYQGRQHSATYAADVERIAALRAAGWIVIEVTSALFASPDRLVSRVRDALCSRRVRTPHAPHAPHAQV